MIKKTLFAGQLLLFCLSMYSATPEEITIPGTFYRLSNGMNVILSPDKHLSSTAIMVYHKNGIVDDSSAVFGCSYMYRDFINAPTSNLAPYERALFVESNGGKRNRKINYDNSWFSFVLPETAHIKSLWVESQRINSLQIDLASVGLTKKKLYSRISDIVKRNHHFRAHEWVKQKIYEGSSYRLPLYGDITSMQQASNKVILNNLKKYSNPANIILVVCGKFNEKLVKQTIQKHFGNIPSRGLSILRKYRTVKPGKKLVYKNWVLPEVKRNYAVIGVRAPSKLTLDYVTFDVIRYWLCDKRISMIKRNLRSKKDINVETIFEYTDNIEVNALLIKLVAEKRIDLERAKLITRNTMAKLKTRINSMKLKQIKNLITFDLINKIQNIESRALLLASSLHYHNDLNIYRRYIRKLKKVTPNDIINVKNRYFKKENQVILNVYKKID